MRITEYKEKFNKILARSIGSSRIRRLFYRELLRVRVRLCLAARIFKAKLSLAQFSRVRNSIYRDAVTLIPSGN